MTHDRTGTTAVEPESIGQDVHGRQNIRRRNRVARLSQFVFRASIVVGIVALAALLYNVAVESFGYVAVQTKIDAATLAVGGVSYEQLNKDQLIEVVKTHVSAGVVRRLDREQPLAQRSEDDLRAIVEERVIAPEVLEAWPLTESLFNRAEIEQFVREKYPRAHLEFRSWVNPAFVLKPQSSVPALAGVRTALLGSLWMILITIVIAFPLGVGAAIYLQEYAGDNLVNRIVQTNINNLAGVPSIIYGMLGLAIFVRSLEALTSGALFGVTNPTTANGRTILSASLTMALLVLPVIIINAQEAIRAVPNSLRQAGYALGATRWQIVWAHVLPNAMPGILTGTILAMSRAIGETAPLVVIGASTFIAVDPGGPFSKFTALPIQIYQWTARPQQEFRHIAAAAIVVLLLVLLSLNATAVLLRNRFSRRY